MRASHRGRSAASVALPRRDGPTSRAPTPSCSQREPTWLRGQRPAPRARLRWGRRVPPEVPGRQWVPRSRRHPRTGARPSAWSGDAGCVDTMSVMTYGGLTHAALREDRVAGPITPDEAASFQASAERIAGAVNSFLQGKPEVVRAGPDVPARRGSPAARGRARRRQDLAGQGSLAVASAAPWQRIQFTPDLLPGDVTGVTVFDQDNSAVRVPPGPGVRQHRARRRDQPGVAEDPVGAAGGDGGAPGDRGRRPLSRARGRSW